MLANNNNRNVHLRIIFIHPVAKDASAGECGLDVSDEGDMVQFGEDQYEQTLHSDGRHLRSTTPPSLWWWRNMLKK